MRLLTNFLAQSFILGDEQDGAGSCRSDRSQLTSPSRGRKLGGRPRRRHWAILQNDAKADERSGYQDARSARRAGSSRLRPIQLLDELEDQHIVDHAHAMKERVVLKSASDAAGSS